MGLRVGDWMVELLPESRPRIVVVEASAKCSLGCSYCFRNTVEDELDVMEHRILRRVVEEASGAGVERITFTGWGEPLENPYTMDALALAKSKGLRVALNTNGVSLADYARELVRLRVDEVIVSVDAFSREAVGVHRRRMDRVLEGLEALNAERRRLGVKEPRITLWFTVTRRNYRELEKAPLFAARMGAGRVVVSNIIPLSAVDEEELACYSSEECASYVEKLAPKLGAELFYAYVEVNLPYMKPSLERRCPYAFNNAVFIRWDGKVAPCMAYAHTWRMRLMNVTRRIEAVVFGEVGEGLTRVWKRSDYASFRFRALVGYMPSCLDCRMREYCEVTLSNERDCWGNSPSCHFCPFLHGMVQCPI